MKLTIRFYETAGKEKSATVTIGKVKFYLKYIRYDKETVYFDMNCPILDLGQYQDCFIFIKANKIQHIFIEDDAYNIEIPYTKSVSSKTYKEIIRTVFNSATFKKYYTEFANYIKDDINSELVEAEEKARVLRNQLSLIENSEID